MIDSHFDTIGNWIGRVPQAGDDVEFRAQVVGTTEDGQPIYGTAISCTDMHSASAGDGSGQYNSVTLDPNYSATVTLVNGFTTRALALLGAGNRLDQPVSGTDIQVVGGFYGPLSEAFTWYGGTLNSTPNLATVLITGSTTTGTIAPAGAGHVGLGSNLTLASGASVVFDPGEIDCSNNPEINVGDYCTADVQPHTITSTVKYVGVKQINVVGTDPLFRVGGPGTFDGTGVPLYNSGGLVDIYGLATVKLGGSVTVGQNIFQSSYYQDGPSGRLHIESGSTLDVEKTAKIVDGALRTFYNGSLADNVTAQTATLKGGVTLSGGVVEICKKQALQPKHYGTFYVEGAVTINGGTYSPGINSTTSGVNDHWESEGNFTLVLGNTATLSPNNSNGANTVANGVWQIIKSRTGTYAGTFATTNLQYDAGPPAKSYTFNTGGNPVNVVNLTS